MFFRYREVIENVVHEINVIVRTKPMWTLTWITFSYDSKSEVKSTLTFTKSIYALLVSFTLATAWFEIQVKHYINASSTETFHLMHKRPERIWIAVRFPKKLKRYSGYGWNNLTFRNKIQVQVNWSSTSKCIVILCLL